jgi:beta-galactosidase
MHKWLLLWFCLSIVLAPVFSQSKRDRLFNDNWFFKNDSTIDASGANYDDSNWRHLDLPHDWSIEDLPNQKKDSVIGPFDRNSVGQGATGFTVGGTGWYRKTFTSEKSFKDGIVSIYFDGVYMNSDVWLNGHHIGNHPYGYTAFQYDLTPYLNPTGKENILAVRVRNTGKNSRWYSGSGIYRSVLLTVTDPIHVSPWGIHAVTREIGQGKAAIQISAEVRNRSGQVQTVTLKHTIISPGGKAVANGEKSLRIEKGASMTEVHSLSVEAPALWSIESPRLYRVVTEIRSGNKTVDRVETTFGIRSIFVSADKGFQLNGKTILLKGGCVHHDNGPLGAAVYYRAEERKIEILKRNGFNAIRTSHNPPSREMLDACDRLGMLVVDEAFDMWEKPKNPQDYHLYFQKSWQHDLDAMVLRDRNHPSVIFWSIGNEIKERVDSSGIRITKALAERVHELDPSRPITEALCAFWDNPGYKWESTAPAFALLGVSGYNYLLSEYENDHQGFPSRVMLGTESFPTQALENWNMVEKLPYVIGDFVWTAFDYMGEASIGNTSYESTRKVNMSLGWPWFNAYCGDLDLIGNKKPQSYYRDVVWRTRPIAMAVHAPVPDGLVENVSYWGWPDEMQSWTWPEAVGKTLQVRVFSRAQSIRLFLNNRLVDERQIDANSITAVFNVPYEPGVLKAIGMSGGEKNDSIEFKTSGVPKAIRLTVDQTVINPDSDLAYVTAEIVNEAGEVVPNASVPVNFSVSGAGTIVGVGNGNPKEMASFQLPSCNSWRGKCLAIIRSSGTKGSVTINGTSGSLTSDQVVVEIR